MKTFTYVSLLIFLTACGSMRDKVVKNGETQPTLTETFKEKITAESVNQHIASWPQDSREAYGVIFIKHGLPQGVTNDMLVWNNVSPYIRTIVHKEGISHTSPRWHLDVVEHFTNTHVRKCDGELRKVSALGK